MSFLTDYKRFNGFLLIGGLSFLITILGNKSLVFILIGFFSLLTGIIFIIYISFSIIDIDKTNSQRVNLSGISFLYLLCFDIEIIAIRYYFFGKNFDWFNFLFLAILWIIFYSFGLWIIYTIHKEEKQISLEN